MEWKKLNYFYKHMKIVKSSLASISLNSRTELSRTQFFHVSIVHGVRNKVFTSVILGKNLLANDRLDVLINEKNILWEVITPKYTVDSDGNNARWLVRTDEKLKKLVFWGL